jgi:gliding motility-associated-like protein
MLQEAINSRYPIDVDPLVTQWNLESFTALPFLSPKMKCSVALCRSRISLSGAWTIKKFISGWTVSTNAERDAQEAGVYRVSISNKCGFVEDSVVYRISDIPVVDLGEDTVLCGNFRVQLDAENPGATYLWLPTGETTQVIQATEQTTYEVVVTNADGCEASGTFTIGSGCISEYYIPTAFSPNEDGLNDVFKPTLVNFEQYELLIFNKWGEVIFRTKDVNQGWDGTYQGTPLEPGIYSYMMRFITTEDGEFQNKNGQVFLIK